MIRVEGDTGDRGKGSYEKRRYFKTIRSTPYRVEEPSGEKNNHRVKSKNPQECFRKIRQPGRPSKNNFWCKIASKQFSIGY
jgi:hypothetical protein